MSVASVAGRPASGLETEDTGVRSRPGYTWQCGPYWYICCCLSLCLNLITKLNVFLLELIIRVDL